MTKVIRLKNDTYLNGTVIESGSNTNGNYVKYADGRMECWGKKTLNNIPITSTTQSGVYISSWQAGITYAKEFISVPDIQNIFVHHTATRIWLEPQIGALTKSSTSGYFLVSESSTTLSEVTIGYFAIGRWK